MLELVKVSELEGRELDFAVALCENLPIEFDPMGLGKCFDGGYWVWDDESEWLCKRNYQKIGRQGQKDQDQSRTYSPSVIWNQGGKIIEEKLFDLSFAKDLYGNEFLIAAMRFYVQTKYGDSIHIPRNLLQF